MLIAHINAVEDHLLAISKIPANSGHSLHKGTPREAFIREFLESHLNSTVAIGSGEIIDSQSQPGGKRNQFDIVIYKRNYPRLDFGGGISGFLAESVVATIEVKSTLDKAGVAQAVGAARNAKALQKHEIKSFSSGYIPPSILSFVVAYDGPAKMETVHTWVKEVYQVGGIVEPAMPAEGDRSAIASPALEGVFVLGKGFLNYDNAPYGFVRPEARKTHPEIRWAIANSERGSLLSLFVLLTVATSNVEGAWLNPLPYLGGFKVSDLQFGV
ncbi:DUF6602 domain-containing protein [Aromatoleum evansii]|uniref:DUF6602 domain-containing protein n=1 Tax=Aromatoleum evansii TaxID=59406 RepID=A0ABZ1AGS3_AROEV|nr:DUF6602 domain-containing protein [Aromatoleum evansii]